MPPVNLKETHKPNATKIAIDMAPSHSLDQVLDILKKNGVLQVYNVSPQTVNSTKNLNLVNLSISETKSAE